MSRELDPLVTAWLTDEALPGAVITEVTVLSGGYANENLLLVTARGERYVLRRYLRPNSERTLGIEAAIAGLVRGTVPVATVVATGSPTGEPLLLSEFVPGELVGAALAGGVDPGGLGVAVGATLAAIGSVGFATSGFFEGPDLVPVPGSVTGGLVDFVDRCLAAGVADHVLARRDLLALAEAAQPVLDSLDDVGRLVHSDFNPKNLLVARDGGRWRVTAVLDWEFAFSGHPLVDVGNLLRFREDHPPAFEEGFLAGFVAGGGELPGGWRAAAEALDLFALADLLGRGPASPLFGKVVAVLNARLGARRPA
jgi:aminoglycoside phosphotransferase (APT) family kinase protein